MKNRICLVTGGTSGVGRATATGLAELGATVILVSSSAQRGNTAVENMKRRTGNENIHFRKLDLGDLASIYEFAVQFKKDFDALHVLSNNAAVLPLKRELTADGFERIFGINYLGHFALTNLLLDLLKSSAPSRVLSVSGNPWLLSKGKIELDDINSDQSFNPFKATFRSAVAKVAFSFELSKRIAGSGVTSNTFHPGLVKTHLTQNFPGVIRVMLGLGQLFFSEDCRNSIYLASSPDVEKVSGKFFKNKTIVSFNPKPSFERDAASLWDMSAKLANL